MDYLFITFSNPHEDILKILNSILYEFIWNGKCDKINRYILVQDLKDGRAKMTEFVKLLKSQDMIYINYLVGYATVEYLSLIYYNNFWTDVLEALDTRRTLQKLGSGTTTMYMEK